MTSIAASALTKDFGHTRAVDNVSFDLPDGGVIGLVGPNGSGKSTLIRVLLGLISPTSGSGEVLGHSIRNPSAYVDRVGALIEAPAFYPTLTGEENLRLFATLGGHHRVRTEEVLETVGLRTRSGDKVKQYSLGMKQRLGIGAALLPDPDLLVLDEPANGLDPAGIVEVRELLVGLGASGRTVFVSSHILSEIQAACDWIVMIDHGGLVFSGALLDLLDRASPTIHASTEDPADTPRLIEIAANAGHKARTDNGAVEVDAPGEWAAELNRLAFQAGITLRELRTASADLEQAFFAMTNSQEKGK